MWEQTYQSVLELISATTNETPEGLCLFVKDVMSWFVFDPSRQIAVDAASFIVATDYGRWVKIQHTNVSDVPLILTRFSQMLPTCNMFSLWSDSLLEQRLNQISVILSYDGGYGTPCPFTFFNRHFFDKSAFFVSSAVPGKKYNFTILNRHAKPDNLWLAPNHTLKIWVLDNLTLLMFPFWMYGNRISASSENNVQSIQYVLLEWLKKNASQYVQLDNFGELFSLTFSNVNNLIFIETVFKEDESSDPFRAHLPCDFYPTQIHPDPQSFSEELILHTRSAEFIPGQWSFFISLFQNFQIPSECAILLDGVFLVSDTINDSTAFDWMLENNDNLTVLADIEDPWGDSTQISWKENLHEQTEGFVSNFDWDWAASYQIPYDYEHPGNHTFRDPHVHISEEV